MQKIKASETVEKVQTWRANKHNTQYSGKKIVSRFLSALSIWPTSCAYIERACDCVCACSSRSSNTKFASPNMTNNIMNNNS